MLQKLEDFYLGTLRFVVILVATLLLVAMFVLGTKATSLAHERPQPSTATPSVSVSSLKSIVIEAPLATESGQAIISPDSNSASDPNQIYYLQTGQAINTYLDRLYPGQYKIDTEALAKFVKEKVESDRPSEQQALFAKALAKAIPGLLADNAFVAYGKDRSPDDIIKKVLAAFTDEFDRQVADVDAKNRAAEDAYLAEQATSRQNLMFAIYAFGIFLLVVFLSIIIRIERNLRPAKPAGLP
jgi:hypothetical protein